MDRRVPEPAWYELHVPAPPAVRDIIVAFLAEAGTTGCQELDDTIVAYFEGKAPRRIARSLWQLMRGMGYTLAPQELRIHRVVNQNWAETWKSFVGPVQVSPRIVICPTWAPAPRPEGGVLIWLDPGMAFGSGHHATTRGMLLLLEEYVAPGQIALDVGTGSGILAIAACKLGAGEVFACDTDIGAVPIARDNARRNQVEGQIHLWVGSVDACRGRSYDLITANITAQALLPLIADLRRLLCHTGVLLLSGILAQEEEVFARALADESLRTVKRLQIEEWVSLVAVPGS